MSRSVPSSVATSPSARSLEPIAGRAAAVTTVAQAYLVACYVLGCVLPYLWRDRTPPPTWLWYAGGWLFGVPGFVVTVLGPYVTLPVAGFGAAAWFGSRRWVSCRTSMWLLAGTLACLAVTAFSLTPLGAQIRIFTLD